MANYGKNIAVASGFDLGAHAPVDSRYVAADTNERNAIVTKGAAYKGMLVYVVEDGIIYRYDGDTTDQVWSTFGETEPTTVSVSGDVVDTTVTVGDSASASLALTLKDVVEAGTACKVTFNDKGLVTGVETLLASDIPTLTLDKISDAGTAAAKDAGTSAGQVLLIGDDGKIDENVLPALAISQVNVVDSEAAMLALEAQTGDVAVRSDLEKSFMLKQTPASEVDNWVELKSPTDLVQSVNGKTGTVVLGTDDIDEGSTNLYYTEERATANFTTNFALANSTDLADTATLVRVGDSIAATCITEDETHRFVTDEEKAYWNGKTQITVGTDSAAALDSMSIGDFYLEEVPAA